MSYELIVSREVQCHPLAGVQGVASSELNFSHVSRFTIRIAY